MRQRKLYGLILLAVLSIACEEAVIDPFSNDGKYFTLYGYLDSLNPNHELRVIPVTRRAQKITDPENPESQLDATVTSINMLSGETIRWSHSLDQLDDGTYAHIFRARFIITEGVTYRIEVARSDGIMTYAETKVPTIPDIELFENGPVQISADSSVVTQDIHIPKIESPWGIQAIYIWGAGLGNDNTRIFVPYGRPGERTPDGGWNLTLQISADQVHVRENIRELTQDLENQDLPIVLTSMGVQLRVLDDNWDPPEGVFDPEVLANPNTLTNVVNGYGFWGSVGLFRQEWGVCTLSGVLGYTPDPTGSTC